MWVRVIGSVDRILGEDDQLFVAGCKYCRHIGHTIPASNQNIAISVVKEKHATSGLHLSPQP